MTETALNTVADDLEALLNDLDNTPMPAIETKAPAKEQAKAQAKPVEQPVIDLTVEHVAGEFTEMTAAVTDKVKQKKAAAIQSQFDARIAYEKAKNPDNEKMEANLTGYAKKMTTLPLAAVLAATDIDPAFINREIAAGKRFNVYAIDKVNDILTRLETGHGRNEINAAVMRSLFKFRAAGVPFTGPMAVAAASDKVKVEKAMEKLLVRYTVSPATAPTQSSSTMNALQTLGVVVNRGTAKFPVWVLTDTPQTRRLEEVLAA